MCLSECRFLEMSGSSKEEVVVASSPVRAAASALLLSPYHAPPPVPPPPHPPGEESDEAHTREKRTLTFAREKPMQAMAFPFPCEWLSQALQWGKETAALIFPRAFSDLEGLEEEMKRGDAALKGEGASSALEDSPSAPFLPLSSSSALPKCCQSSYRVLCMSLLLPFLPISSDSPLPPPPPSASSGDLPSSSLSSSSISAPSSPPNSPSPLSRAHPWPHPESHPEVLFDCPVDHPVGGEENADGALEWPSKHSSDEEDDGERYFHHIYERYLAMAEGQHNTTPPHTETDRERHHTQHSPPLSIHRGPHNLLTR